MLEGRKRGHRWRANPVLLALAVFFLPGSATRGVASAAGLLAANYQLNWDQAVDRTDAGTTDVKKFKQAIEVKAKGYVSPVINNQLTLKIEQEINSDSADIVRLLPTLELGFRGNYWELKAGAKRTDENSDEPGKSARISDSYFVEASYLAPKRVPDVKVKFTLDADAEAGVTDTQKAGVTVSSAYNPNNWLNLKGDYERNTLDDRMKADSGTEDEKARGTFGLRHVLSDKVKVETSYVVEESRAATLKSDGTGAVDGTVKRDQTHTWKNLLGFRPFRDTSIDATYDFDLKQDMVLGEHNLTGNSKVTASQKIGAPIDLRAVFAQAVTEMRHTMDDNRKTENTWTAEIKTRFSKQVDISLKYEKKDTDEAHADPTKSTTSGSVIRNATWTGELAPFWKASASVDTTENIVLDVKTTADTKYSLKTTFDFKAIALTLDPSYDITMLEDFTTGKSTVTRDFKFKIAYSMVATRTVEAKFDHTYGRKTDTGAGNIQRTDTTNGNIVWKNPLPGWMIGVDLIRQATDTSGDDLPPDITSTFGFKADYKFRWLALGTTWKYDKKSIGDDATNIDAKAGWTAPKWDASLTYTWKKTYSTALSEGYAISLTFKYNL